jgi:hypothetical protein
MTLRALGRPTEIEAIVRNSHDSDFPFLFLTWVSSGLRQYTIDDHTAFGWNSPLSFFSASDLQVACISAAIPILDLGTLTRAERPARVFFSPSLSFFASRAKHGSRPPNFLPLSVEQKSRQSEKIKRMHANAA